MDAISTLTRNHTQHTTQHPLTHSSNMVSNILVGALLSIPHIMYAFIWFFPEKWMKAFGKQSVHVFATVASALKVVQFTSVALWLYYSPFSFANVEGW